VGGRALEEGAIEFAQGEAAGTTWAVRYTCFLVVVAMTAEMRVAGRYHQEVAVKAGTARL
jgi:hypothetical protein